MTGSLGRYVYEPPAAAITAALAKRLVTRPAPADQSLLGANRANEADETGRHRMQRASGWRRRMHHRMMHDRRRRRR
jgi:hypothetical protein